MALSSDGRNMKLEQKTAIVARVSEKIGAAVTKAFA